MYRNIINDFATWYDQAKRKILYVKGAKGVGKTWTVRDFATAFFKQQFYINLAEDTACQEAIAGESNMDLLLSQRFSTDDISESIFIFDEVQIVPNCAEFFYAFRKSHPEYTICLIASSMEFTEFEYSHPDVFDILRMRPMTFEEYMIASKAHPFLDAIAKHKDTPLTNLEIGAISSMLREYLLVGGMPGIVHAYLKNRDLSVVRPMQEIMLEDYIQLAKQTFSTALYQRCKRILRSIPEQLARENKKFMYKCVDSNARSREYAEAAQALCSLGLVRKLPRLTNGTLPLEDHVDYKSFELFFIDHGLLRAAYGLPMSEDIDVNDILEEKCGAIAEQFIFQELSSQIPYLYYWVSGATARVPFVYEGEDAPVPVDIRFVPNSKAQNIKTFRSKNANTKITVKISFNQVSLDGDTLNIPAYGLWNM